MISIPVCLRFISEQSFSECWRGLGVPSPRRDVSIGMMADVCPAQHLHPQPRHSKSEVVSLELSQDYHLEGAFLLLPTSGPLATRTLTTPS